MYKNPFQKILLVDVILTEEKKLKFGTCNGGSKIVGSTVNYYVIIQTHYSLNLQTLKGLKEQEGFT